MKIDIPSGGCFYATGSNTFAHQSGSTRTTYYLQPDNYKLVRGSTSTNTNSPSGVYCLSYGDLLYKSEVTDIIFPIACIIFFVILFKFFVNLMFKGWTK